MSKQPTSDEQQEADRLDAVYKAWLAGASAPPDDQLNPVVAQTALAVVRGLNAPAPTPVRKRTRASASS